MVLVEERIEAMMVRRRQRGAGVLYRACTLVETVVTLWPLRDVFGPREVAATRRLLSESGVSE